MLILRDGRQGLPTMGVSDSGQHSSKPCQACVSQRGNEQAGVGVQGGHLAVDMVMATIHLGNESMDFLLNALCMGTESSETISYIPKHFLLHYWQLLPLLSFFPFYWTSCLLKMSGF